MVRLTPIDIKSLPAEELRERLAEKAIPAFRARQIQDWLDKGVSDFAQMSNLPQALREELSQTFTIPCVKIEKKLVSSLDNTVKYLYGLPDLLSPSHVHAVSLKVPPWHGVSMPVPAPE